MASTTGEQAGPVYRLVRGARRVATEPVLDPSQRAVVDHAGGPLLVLAGPGTGKTTTIVETVVDRVRRGTSPERVLVLTFGRAAAAELRERVTARLGAATREPVARTFHSYAFGVLRREAVLRGEPTPRLLSGPEQDLVVRELLDGTTRVTWPESVEAALGTRGFAQELRDLLLRAYERGVGPIQLARLGRDQKRADWVAAGRFFEEYLQVTALRDQSAYDPAELIRATVELWQRDAAAHQAERGRYDLVLVDELQDTDPSQLDLLDLLAGKGADLVAVGDPDQSIYGFRGAEVDGLLTFPQRFRTVGGADAPTIALDVSRRTGGELLAASRRVAAGLRGPGRHRRLGAAEGVPPGALEVALLRSPGQEAALVAARLREAHLRDGVPWSQMAVLVRSTVATLPAMRRALGAAGVPVEVPGDQVPLVEQPAVRPLLTLLDVALRPDRLDEDVAVSLLTSPLGGADVLGLRRLRQELRRAELAAGGLRASGVLLVEALAEPSETAALDPGAVRPAARIARLVATAREQMAAGGTVEDVLWAVWQASGLARQWESASARGGTMGAAADRDLDAVLALFDDAAKFVDRLPGAGPGVFLDHVLGQQIPAESFAPRSEPGEAVRVMTAHAAKGLEWDVVCVAGVQEGTWPDLRMRGSFLGSEQLVELIRTGGATTGRAATASALARLLDEERRLFYVAVTRARRRLLVTAVLSEREGLTPSRFLDDLDPLPGEEERPVVAVPRALAPVGVVSMLRQVAVDDGANEERRAAAAAELARLAAARIPGADPEHWWGLRALSDERPLRDDGELVPVSPSRVEAFTRCELRWFLEHSGGSEPSTAAQGVGTAVHAVAAVARVGDAEESLVASLDRFLSSADLGRGWSARAQTERAREMVRRFARWFATNERELVATELAFRAEVGRAAISGRVDRLERDADGRGVVVDLKTGTSKPDAEELLGHPQLAAYQVAVEHGAFAEQGITESGGAALVQLGKAATKEAREQPQPALSGADDPRWAEQLVEQVAEGMAGSAFDAMTNRLCDRCPVRTSCPVRDEGQAVTS